jgi:hypothetical protein
MKDTFKLLQMSIFAFLVGSNINTYVYAGIVIWQTMVLNSARTGLHKYEECNVWIISNDEEIRRWRLTKYEGDFFYIKRISLFKDKDHLHCLVLYNYSYSSNI